MSEAVAIETPGIGHNQPITDIEALSAELRDNYRALTARRDELVAGLVNVPTDVVDDETSGKIGDFIKQLDTCIKQAESHREGEKAPFLQGGRIVDGFFNSIKESLAGIRKACADRDRIYKAEKEERERLAREETARLAQEEADRARRAAEERERIAQEAREKAERERAEAEAALKAEQEAREAERLEAERKAKEEDERIAREAVEAAKDAENEEERKRIEAVQAERDVEARITAAADTAAREAREAVEAKQRVADDKAREARQKAEQRQADRDNREAALVAKRADTAAAKANRAAGASTAELSRTRGEHGSVGGISVTWIHDEASVDRNKLDLEALRHHLPEDGLHKAIRSFITAGGRKLRGAEILEDRKSTYR